MEASVNHDCRPFPRVVASLLPEWMTHWTRSSISTSHSAINNIRHPVELSLVVAGVRAALIYHNGRWFWEALASEAGRFFDENKQKIIIIKMKSGRSSLAAANGSPPGSSRPAPPLQATRYTITHSTSYHMLQGIQSSHLRYRKRAWLIFNRRLLFEYYYYNSNS